MSYIEDNGTFTFAGLTSATYGVWIEGSRTYNAADRRYTEYVIPGRNGTLTLDEGAFNDIDHEYPAFIAAQFPANIEAFRNAILSKAGYQRLTDSYHPGEFYRARYTDGLDVDVATRAIGGKFTVKFRRDPRRFLTSGETAVTLTANGSITNPTLYDAKPLLRVYGTGTLSIGSDSIIISAADSYTDIDCEIQDAFKGTVNKNPFVRVTGDQFPVLKPGANGITLGSGITRVIITPRWWKL